jgi:hypothetical protein
MGYEPKFWRKYKRVKKEYSEKNTGKDIDTWRHRGTISLLHEESITTLALIFKTLNFQHDYCTE